MDTKEPQQPKANNVLTNTKILSFATEFGFIIAIPLLTFIFLGKCLNKRYDQTFFTIIGVLLALTVSTIWLYKKIKDLKDEIDKH